MKYYHVDVFTSEPLAGNGLTVVFPSADIEPEMMLMITQEFKQFETIFIFPKKNGCFPVRIFTVDEELDFAGHPILGAAAVIHHLQKDNLKEVNINIAAGARLISLSSKKNNIWYSVTMNQGQPVFLRTPDEDEYTDIITALNLTIDDLYPGYPLEVVSTGLPYLLIPVKDALAKVKFNITDIEPLLETVGAKFAYLFDPGTLECRSWDNAGLVEDVATGSAAGPLCAYLVKNGYKSSGEKIFLHQGRFVNRDSIITGWVDEHSGDVMIEGDVALFGFGELAL
ncbi:MAG: PhzF family phenazine biosynthesis protein [Spirochaetales bacterium]|nr:PhzF family phenazine biosynthesis protein [Spirochaetales bacterium]